MQIDFGRGACLSIKPNSGDICHRSDRVPDLNTDYERAWVGRAKAKASTRAKWRSSTSACWGVLENCLTPPTLSETRFNVKKSPMHPVFDFVFTQ